MKHICRLAGILVVPLILASCGSPPDVIVVDDAGAPVAAAKVMPMAASVNYEQVLTDAKGQADIPDSSVQPLQPVQQIAVEKAGYTRQFIDFNQPKPIRVVLKP